jgi:hypothetical protein
VEHLRWEKLLPALRDFQSLLAPAIPPLTVIAASDRTWTDEEYRQRRPKGFARMRGVYLLFGPDERLLYVGLAMWSFDKRVWSHDAEIDRRWTDVIPFPDNLVCLAPALEFFLISRLDPPGNKTYRGYGAGEGAGVQGR